MIKLKNILEVIKVPTSLKFLKGQYVVVTAKSRVDYTFLTQRGGTLVVSNGEIKKGVFKFKSTI